MDLGIHSALTAAGIDADGLRDFLIDEGDKRWPGMELCIGYATYDRLDRRKASGLPSAYSVLSAVGVARGKRAWFDFALAFTGRRVGNRADTNLQRHRDCVSRILYTWIPGGK